MLRRSRASKPDKQNGVSDIEDRIKAGKNKGAFNPEFADPAQPSRSYAPVPLEKVLSHAKSFAWVYEQPEGIADFWIDNVTLFKNHR